jgi:phospholipid/cholesterol/gamma-HCH transport system ATP-binding protein
MEQVPIIKVRNLSAAYGDNIVLNDISFDVLKGQVFVILGGSGCGKSTLLKQMIGLYEPVSGQILINGVDIVTVGGREKLALLRQIGVAYQSGALFGSHRPDETEAGGSG